MAHCDAYETRSDAAILVLTARASLHLEVPFMDSLLGPNGRHDIIANIDSKPPADVETEATKSEREPYFPEAAIKNSGERYATKLPRHPPQWLMQLLQVIQDNAGEDEIFRKPGNGKRIKELMVAINKGVDCNFQLNLAKKNCSIHDLVSLLKGYINHFEDPLIPHYQNEVFCQTVDIKCSEKRIESMQVLSLLCPYSNRVILQKLFACLQAVETQSMANRMTIDNLTTCITPSIIRQNGLKLLQLSPEQAFQHSRDEANVVHFMLKHAAHIFERPAWLDAAMARQEHELKHLDEHLAASNNKENDLAEVKVHAAVKMNTNRALEDLYRSISKTIEQTACTPDEKKQKTLLLKYKQRMEKAGAPGTPNATSVPTHVSSALKPLNTPLKQLQMPAPVCSLETPNKKIMYHRETLV